MNWIRANPSRRRERLENACTCPTGALSDQDSSDSFLVSAWSKLMITLTSLKKLKFSQLITRATDCILLTT